MSRVAVNLPPSKSDTSAWIARRIREAREEAGLTQAELATRLDRTQTSVSYWESGKRVPGIDDLVEVSVAVGKGVHYFLPPSAPATPARRARARRSRPRLASGELDQAVGALLDEAEHAELPERLVTIRSTQPAHAANELIEAALIDGPPVDVHRLAAICGILVLTRKFPDVLSGLILELDHGAIVGINSRHASVRQRFSVGHELGHHLLRHADRFHIDVSDGASPDHDYASERAANEFAAELLMPRRFVARAFHENPNPSSLADLFEVSAIAMGYRLVNLGLR
jgi:Zn-dependent peptidase ImmA (M78 family)/transcriptional regulator with XRE-family HTH domain